MHVNCTKQWGANSSIIIDSVLFTGMEIYPLHQSFWEGIPVPLLAGVIGGVCFLFVAIILSLVTACFMSQRRRQRRRKRRKGKTSEHNAKKYVTVCIGVQKREIVFIKYILIW